MKEDEFQACLRHTDVYFRRFLIALKFTGARPSELSRLKWTDIDWNRGLASLDKHKTAQKTGKPRVIVFVPQMLKMLAIIKRDQHGPAAVELRRILESAPDRTASASHVSFQMKQRGFSDRALYSARESIGAVSERKGGWGPHGYHVYRLPDNAVTKVPPHPEFVFLCSRHRPWLRMAMVTKFKRLRKAADLPADCKMYCTRHLFATRAVKLGVNMKAVATLLGHTDTKMLERIYCHVDGDHAFLREAAASAVNLAGSPVPAAVPADAVAWEELMEAKYPKAKPKAKKPSKRRGTRPALLECEQSAYDAFNFAVANDGYVATDIEAYEWLLGRPEFAGKLPPSSHAFARYLRRARLFHRGASKRKLHRERWGHLDEVAPEHRGDLQDCEIIAYQAYQFAKKANPGLKTNRHAFEYLVRQPEYADHLPHSPETFKRYLTRARQHFESIGYESAYQRDADPA
jgi:integrase